MIILSSQAVLSPRICRGSVAELATSDFEPLPAIGVKRRRGGQGKGGMHVGPCDHLLTFLGPGDRLQSRIRPWPGTLRILRRRLTE